ncbi:hypothetical protein [Nonomuraea lactucae]|nr:hypothetical protein [Nonomuraea lactucae]
MTDIDSDATQCPDCGEMTIPGLCIFHPTVSKCPDCACPGCEADAQ